MKIGSKYVRSTDPTTAIAYMKLQNWRTRLNYPRVSAIEFGCGGGEGLLNAEMHIEQLEKISR